MENEPRLRQTRTQEDVDDAFEIWLDVAEKLGILGIYQVISYFCPDGSTDEVRAITFAVDKESLIASAKKTLEGDKLQQPMFAKIH